MANDPVLGLLGLARRASKLVCGDAAVCDLCADKKARCVFVAADAGAGIVRKAALYAESANVPLVTLPYDKDALGLAVGREGSAICAVSDIGLAAAAMSKLAAQQPQYAAVATQLGEKNARIQSRKGKKKPRDRAAQSGGDEAPVTPAKAQHKPIGKRAAHSQGKSSWRKPSENQRAKRVSNRKSPHSDAKR